MYQGQEAVFIPSRSHGYSIYLATYLGVWKWDNMRMVRKVGEKWKLILLSPGYPQWGNVPTLDTWSVLNLPLQDACSSLQVFNAIIIIKKMTSTKMTQLKHFLMVLHQLFDVARRVVLRRATKMLVYNNVVWNQKEDVKAVIKMYENGDLPKRPCERIFVQDGKLCRDLPDFRRGTPCGPGGQEGNAMQYAQISLAKRSALSRAAAHQQKIAAQ
ncbi:hypothetical protein V8E54_008353 [Elaphomyces granulatus]